ncbi:DNA/RNA non-specific endonuclease [Gottfriedia acidiceleris]|uniref:DNA/RNA non-specific endonuclease n=1 Tax=Gottfriedia acidiceleris TaxID=371036 RepID=A0ABY4JKE6_9BACI|nr:DNA/RNA non-specific endonuclease [Gottfriedia acidiceleris]UPM53634.1 DNA/RNA non-specific endonuclease [Gottfriedia acidiceleris]
MNKRILLILFTVILLSVIVGCGKITEQTSSKKVETPTSTASNTVEVNKSTSADDKEKPTIDSEPNKSAPASSTSKATGTTGGFDYSKYTLIVVNGGDMSGHRQPNVKVDVGYGEREYWAYTNEYGQLIRVEAKKITLQNSNIDHVLSSGRYYADEANVPGTESSTLDKGHVIADSLGGVSNAYNITPQDSNLNRHGDQAYMEKVIRDARGCTDFVAVIQYLNTKTQIPNHYKFTYKIQGRSITDEFDNVNPDEVNKNLGNTKVASSTPKKTDVPANKTKNSNEDVSKVDTNHNGSVTIAEAKAAGFKMPITRNSWLYKYMDDRDGDGLVGE